MFLFFLIYICCYIFVVSFLFFLNPGHLDDIHVCFKTIELDVGKILQYKYLSNSYKAEGFAFLLARSKGGVSAHTRT